MEENTESENQQEEARKESEGEDDVDLYGDLEATGPDANSNVIDRFNKLFSPKNRIRDDDFYDDETGEEEKDDDVGLYDDLNTFEKQLQAEELEAKVDVLEQKCSSLAQQNTELKSELDKEKRKNFALSRNISSIFKTAKAELARKERQLKELQREHDTLVFRRGGASKAPPPAKPTEQIPNDCQILKKDSANGNLVMLEKETECTFQMGKVTISFATESGNFFKQRMDRLKTCNPSSDDIRPPSKEVKLNGSHRPSEKRTEKETTHSSNRNTREISSKSRPKEPSESKKDDREEKGVNAENLEEGEVLEDPPRHDSRENSRSSRSPTSGNKRKRSPSNDKRHHDLRDRVLGPRDRASSSSNRSRPLSRSPVKSSSSSRHRGNRGNVQPRPPRGSDRR